jgi:hypothetical protein
MASAAVITTTTSSFWVVPIEDITRFGIFKQVEGLVLGKGGCGAEEVIGRGRTGWKGEDKIG